jgi:hypothetical protein
MFIGPKITDSYGCFDELWVERWIVHSGRRHYGYLRGCMEDVLNFNVSATRRLNVEKGCERIPMKQLSSRQSDGEIHV